MTTHDFVMGGALMVISATITLVTVAVSPRCPWRRRV